MCPICCIRTHRLVDCKCLAQRRLALPLYRLQLFAETDLVCTLGIAGYREVTRLTTREVDDAVLARESASGLAEGLAEPRNASGQRGIARNESVPEPRLLYDCRLLYSNKGARPSE